MVDDDIYYSIELFLPWYIFLKILFIIYILNDRHLQAQGHKSGPKFYEDGSLIALKEQHH